MDYQPIAIKSFGIDEDSGLEKQLHVVIQTTDVKREKIIVVYDIVLVSPTGKVLVLLETDQYERYNVPGNEKFDQLRASPIGEQTTILIEGDLQMIQAFVTLREDLRQTIPTINT